MNKIASLKDTILEKVDPVDLFAFYIRQSTGQTLRLGKAIKSPLRNEKHPSFNIFRGEDGKVRYKDFADEGGDIFQFVMRLTNKKFKDVLTTIAEDFGIIRGDGSDIKLNGKYYMDRFPKLGVRDKQEFKYIKVEWDKEDEGYWNAYGVSIANLEEYDTWPVNCFSGVTDDRKWVVYSTAGKRIYMYEYGNDTVRFYRPNADLSKKEIKHMGNNTRHDVFGLNQLRKCKNVQDLVVLCAGQKDALALYANTGIRGLALNSESCKLTQEVYLEIMTYTKKLAVCYDLDKTGMKNASELHKNYGLKNISLSSMGVGIKDIADYYLQHNKNNNEHDLLWTKMKSLVLEKK